MPRQDTKLEAEGAEFLVLGELLLHRIPAYKTYTNMPGYDLVATNPDTNRAARIQVKSRWRTGAPFFLIKNLDCEFVVAVRLNRGKKGGGGRVLPPEFFVLPVEVVKSVYRPGPWSKVFFRGIEAYKEKKWSLIAEFLAETGPSARAVADRSAPPDAAKRHG
jgi:hypothetical protein